ncbi:MAG: ABC transporter ATP-binding protein [Leptolyngbyaceae bacterium]|nr:ABC transporter ATP-binding protein [Leptolyngbyaceae bacterium]
MSNVAVKNLNKTYTAKVVPVRDTSLRVEEGEFLTLVGPSGCGKSTTLRIIAGLEQPTRGQVLINDKDVTALRPGDRNIAMVFQSYALYPHMNVYENMASGLKLKGMGDVEIRDRIKDANDVLGLDDLLDRKPANLSGGQRQRVALGRALVRRPDVFLLDEPLSNLDALLREQVRADLKQIFERQSAPVIYVTHDQTEAMTLSTKVAVLHKGDVQQLDSPERIYTRPANKFVASFIGSPQMNLLTLPCEGNQAVLGSSRITLPDRFVPPPEVVLGVRPEHIRIASPGDQPLVKGTVFLVENLGMSYLVSVHVDGSEDTTLRVLLPSDQTWDQQITLTMSPEKLHWFNVQTEERLPDHGA